MLRFGRRTSTNVDGIALYRELNRPLRLFLVEDHPADVMLLRTALTQGPANCQIQVATNGEEAIQLLWPEGRPNASQRPDLLDSARSEPAPAQRACGPPATETGPGTVYYSGGDLHVLATTVRYPGGVPSGGEFLSTQANESGRSI